MVSPTKKLFCLLLILLSFCSIACADEITFRGIPWNANVDEFEDYLGIDVTGIESYLPHWSSFLPRSSMDRSKYLIGYDVTVWGKNIPFQVGGYDLSFVCAYFYYGIENEQLVKSPNAAQFYMAEYIFDVEDVTSAYSDLCGKMNALYGEGSEENGKANKDYYSTVWYGENDTAARLLVRSNSPYNGYSIRLVYGKIDSDKYVDYLEELAYQEKVKEEQASRSDSIEGL